MEEKRYCCRCGSRRQRNLICFDSYSLCLRCYANKYILQVDNEFLDTEKPYKDVSHSQKYRLGEKLPFHVEKELSSSIRKWVVSKRSGK